MRSDVRLEDHFAGREPQVVATFRRLIEVAEMSGPAKVLPEKTRVAFQVRMSLAAFSLRRRWIDGHVVLARRLESPRFRRIDVILAAQPGPRLEAAGARGGRRRSRAMAG
ncbi:MAG: hypothetical protein M3003_06980 [Candidatus Dormibacteraeota bacterium]|nr:hypothetical protein [Candidatus Dormibacteraeota bacterium]